MRRTGVLALTAAVALSLAAPALANHDHGKGKSKDNHGSGSGTDKPKPPPPATYYVGAAIQSINPTADMLKEDFYLGGFGLSSGKVGTQVDPGVYVEKPHKAIGVLGDLANGYGVAVRALAVGDGAHTAILAQLDVQGYFSAYKQGPFGLIDIRNDAAKRIATLAPKRKDLPGAGQILVDSNHSHAGADTAGVWGGVPTSYLQLVHDRAVEAITSAVLSMKPAYLYYGMTHAGVAGQADKYPSYDPLLSNDFSDDPANQVMDDELRVLRAVSKDTGAPIVTYLNFSAHPTVLGGTNRYVSADYTGPLSRMLGSNGGLGFAQVATLGRTHTAGTRCPNTTGLDMARKAMCDGDGYATRVYQHAFDAISSAKPLMGKPVVNMHSFLLTDAAENAPIVALSYAGTVVGAPAYRAVNPPWLTGDVLGTPTFSGRIGDILISGGPGEMYPQILDTVAKSVPARAHFSIGTAGDFLGYLISPLEAYPEPVRHDLFDGPPPPAMSSCGGVVPSPIGCPAPIDSDNHLFNPSFTLGERITCSLLRGAAVAFGQGEQTFWSRYQRCAAFADDLQKPADFDTTFPAQPDLSAVLTH
jgi:hypothetical protein